MDDILELRKTFVQLFHNTGFNVDFYSESVPVNLAVVQSYVFSLNYQEASNFRDQLLIKPKVYKEQTYQKFSDILKELDRESSDLCQSFLTLEGAIVAHINQYERELTEYNIHIYLNYLEKEYRTKILKKYSNPKEWNDNDIVLMQNHVKKSGTDIDKKEIIEDYIIKNIFYSKQKKIKEILESAIFEKTKSFFISKNKADIDDILNLEIIKLI